MANPSLIKFSLPDSLHHLTRGDLVRIGNTWVIIFEITEDSVTFQIDTCDALQ